MDITVFMRYFPVNLDIKHRDCLVVGGGSVGTRKTMMLHDCGAIVTVVSLYFTQQLVNISNNSTLVLKKKPFEQSDLKQRFLVVSATNDENLNHQISTEAGKNNILCNIADRPEVSNFILPAVVNRGDLVIGISTSGKSPAFAKHLRKKLEAEFGDEYAEFLCLMGAIRQTLLRKPHEPETHKCLFEEIISKDIVQMIKENRIDDINAVLFNILGIGFEFDQLVQSDKSS